jgi:hypothetical protein
VLTSERDLMFTILEFGDKAKSVETIEKILCTEENSLNRDSMSGYLKGYDFVLLPNNLLLTTVIDESIYEKHATEGDRILVVRRTFLK